MQQLRRPVCAQRRIHRVRLVESAILTQADSDEMPDSTEDFSTPEQQVLAIKLRRLLYCSQCLVSI